MHILRPAFLIVSIFLSKERIEKRERAQKKRNEELIRKKAKKKKKKI